MTRLALIWCPFGNEEEAAKASAQLLDEGLIACANILPPMRSLYVWQGERGESRETGVIMKTRENLLDAAVSRLSELHHYDTPVIAGWVTGHSTAGVLAWLEDLDSTGLDKTGLSK